MREIYVGNGRAVKDIRARINIQNMDGIITRQGTPKLPDHNPGECENPRALNMISLNFMFRSASSGSSSIFVDSL